MKSCDGRKISGGQAQAEEIDNPDWRKSHWLDEWARRDPSDQHWHLGPVGVLPPYQGKGIGTQLLSLFCKEVDACLAPAYLETDSEKNVRFYERFGFQVIAETDIFDVKNYFMWRNLPAASTCLGVVRTNVVRSPKLVRAKSGNLSAPNDLPGLAYAEVGNHS